MLPNLELEESLIDKSANSFTSLPEFAELVALVNKFGDLLALTPFTYFDLELALQQEEQQQTQKSTEAEASHPLEHNPLIENFVAEVLHFFSKYDSVHMQKKLYWLIVGINRWSFPTFDARLLLPPKEESKMKELIKTNSKLDMGMESEEQSEADEEGKSTTESGSRDHSVNNNKRTTTIAPTCMDSTQIQVIPNHHKSRNVLKPDYLNLSTVNKLKLFCFLVDAQLACAHDSDVHDLLDQDFSCDQQRITPLVIDSAGRKFWYFCDTWLFLEEEKLLIAEEEDRKIQVKICDDQLREKVETHKQSNKKNGRKVKSPKKKNEEVVRIHQQELDEIYANLFTGRQLRVICKCSDHFTQLINAYKGQRNAKQNEWVVEKLEECWKTVQNIENERMKLLLAEQSRKSFSPMRQSSRIALLLERRRKEEAERKVRETAIEQERKRIEKEQMEFLQEHRRLTDSDLQLCGLSREERLKQRQQRIQDQYVRDQLIEAGLLTPSPSAATTEDLDEEMSDEYEQEPYDKRKRRPITNGIDSKIKLLVPKNKSAQQHLTKGEVRPIPRLPAYDWWTPASTPSNDSNPTGLFQSLVHMKKPLQITGLPRQQPTVLNRSMDKRMSLIAPSNADSSYVYNGKTLEEGNARTSRPRMPRFAPSLMNIRNALNLNSTNGTSSSAVKKEEVQEEETGASSATPLFEQQQPSEWQITEKRQPTPLIFRWAPVNPATVLTTENDGQTIADVKMENF